MKVKLLLLVVAFYFIFSSSVVFAQQDWLSQVLTEWSTGGRYSGGIQNMLSMVLGRNVPTEWLSLPNFFYYIVFPFVAAWAVIYGVMEEIQIFRRSTIAHKVVSFVMAAMLLPTGWLMLAVNYLYMIDAVVALFAFGFLFLIGTIFWAVGRGSNIIGENRMERTYGQYQSMKAKYYSDLEKVEREIINAKPGTKDLQKLEAKREEIRKRINFLNEKGRALDIR